MYVVKLGSRFYQLMKKPEFKILMLQSLESNDCCNRTSRGSWKQSSRRRSKWRESSPDRNFIQLTLSFIVLKKNNVYIFFAFYTNCFRDNYTLATSILIKCWCTLHMYLHSSCNLATYPCLGAHHIFTTTLLILVGVYPVH